ETNDAGGSFLGALEHDGLERAGIGERCARQLVVESVPGLVRGKRAKQRSAEQIKVADRVEQLVADELVGEAQAVGIQHALVVQHHGIVEPAAERQAAALEL